MQGQSWEDALREHLLNPLGMSSTGLATGAGAGEPATMAGAARGHRATPIGLDPLPWASNEAYTSRAMAPAGGTLVSTAGDLARLVLVHLSSPSVPPILSPASAATMRALAVRAPGGVTQMLGVGLGWQVWHGSVRAAGANPGQRGVIALDDESRCAVIALTNSDAGVNAIRAALDAGAPPSDAEPEPVLALDTYAGEYESHAGRIVVTVDGDGEGLSAQLVGWSDTAKLTPIDATTFSSPFGPVAFFERESNGRPTLLRWRMRVARRV